MIVHERTDGSVILITQEDHADLSAQFAAHWGNKNFSRLRPYDSMIFATAYHDSGYREWEGCPPVNVEKGRPYGHRENIPSFQDVELQGYQRNIEWVRSHDRYAGLLVSMHRTGLWQNRYQTIRTAKSRHGSTARSPEIQSLIATLEAEQAQERQLLSGSRGEFERELWFNYRLLQVYDILSLYFCTNGYVDDQLTEQVIAPVPLGYGSKEEVDLQLIPEDSRTISARPYPFEISPITVTVRGRLLTPTMLAAEEACRQEYFKARRILLEFDITL